MDYEKAYITALARARGIHSFSSDPAEIKRMEDIFPELRESEDERIRKELTQYLIKSKENERAGSLHGNFDEWIVWLEKQEVQKEDVYTKEFWGEIRKNLFDFLQELCECGTNTNFDRWTKSDCVNWLLWVEKQSEQKSIDKIDEDNLYKVKKIEEDKLREMENDYLRTIPKY